LHPHVDLYEFHSGLDAGDCLSCGDGAADSLPDHSSDRAAVGGLWGTGCAPKWDHGCTPLVDRAAGLSVGLWTSADGVLAPAILVF
jgi:hypothetical protein